MSRLVARLLVAVLAAVALLAVGATPALAHGRGRDTTNYTSRITFEPDLPGVRWKIYNGDEFLGVENTSQTELTVPGYIPGDQFLRIGPEGVFVNRNSEAYYLNQDRYSRVTPPAGVGPEAEPDWVKVSSTPRYAWHHHQIHWMSPVLPPQVRDPGQLTRVSSWKIPFSYGGQQYELGGELLWVPGPSPWPWLLAALPVVTIPALLGLRSKPQAEGWPGLIRPAAATLGVLAVANLIHLVDDLKATPIPWTSTVPAALQTSLFIGIALFGAVRAWQAGDGAFAALGIGSGALLVGQGLLYFPVLGASHSATIFPPALTRAVVAASIVQALPLFFVTVKGNDRQLSEPQPTNVEDPSGYPGGSPTLGSSGG
ncbi:MAG: hypothetical protein ACRDYA_11850 [Egibacteraceae bacterium]